MANVKLLKSNTSNSGPSRGLSNPGWYVLLLVMSNVTVWSNFSIENLVEDAAEYYQCKKFLITRETNRSVHPTGIFLGDTLVK